LLQLLVAQLICPIAFEDPSEVWTEIQNDISERLPLRDVTWKHPVTSVFITISKLPLKFVQANSAYFKDTNHPYRWFLAPYVNLYVISPDTLDAYKSLKQVIKSWVEGNNSRR